LTFHASSMDFTICSPSLLIHSLPRVEISNFHHPCFFLSNFAGPLSIWVLWPRLSLFFDHPPTVYSHILRGGNFVFFLPPPPYSLLSLTLPRRAFPFLVYLLFQARIYVSPPHLYPPLLFRLYRVPRRDNLINSSNSILNSPTPVRLPEIPFTL